MLPVAEPLSKTMEALYRSESGRVLATLVRLLGDLDMNGMRRAASGRMQRTLRNMEDAERGAVGILSPAGWRFRFARRRAF